MLSATRSRLGQRLGQKKRQVSYWAEKYGKSPDFARNQDFLVAETGLELSIFVFHNRIQRRKVLYCNVFMVKRGLCNPPPRMA